MSIMIVPDEGKSSGKIDLYHTKSFTCKLPIGSVAYENDEEQKAWMRILTYGHPEVDVIPITYPVGDIRRHFK